MIFRLIILFGFSFIHAEALACTCRRYITENSYKYADLIVIGNPTKATLDLKKKHPFLSTNRGKDGVSKPSVNMPLTWPYQEILVSEVLKGSLKKKKILVKVNMRDCGLEKITNQEHILFLFHHTKNQYSVTQCSGSGPIINDHPRFKRRLFRLKKKLEAL